MKRMALTFLLSYASVAISFAAPLDMLGVKPGSTHRIALGGGEINARVIETGREGWVLFTVLSDDPRWQRGARLWINLDRIDNISAPTVAPISVTSPKALPSTETEIAGLPCFSQADARESLAAAKGETFDKSQFLTECILGQRKKP